MGQREAQIEITKRLKAIEGMNSGELRAQWQRLFEHDPPKRMSRGLLILGVAWKIQAKSYGGLSASAKRQLNRLGQSITEHGDVRRGRVASLRPGAKLVREWRGERHTVFVLENGFEWQGRRWRSLTAIARTITGARWSGPRFFGLTRASRTESEA